METEKTRQAKDNINDHRKIITKLIEDHGIGVQAMGATVGMNLSERRRGNWAKLYVRLNDEKPGWRVKDEILNGTTRRHDLKVGLQKLLKRLTGKKWAIGLQSNYSYLTPIVGK